MSMKYIRDYYRVNAKRGGRVRYANRCGFGDPREGEIKGARGAYLRILLDGDRTAKTFHPTFDIEYL